MKRFISFKHGHKGYIVNMTVPGWIKGLIRLAYEKVKSDDVPQLTHTQNDGYGNLSDFPPAPSWTANAIFA
jgi:hypothetical protein